MLADQYYIILCIIYHQIVLPIILIGDWKQSTDRSILNNYYEKSTYEEVSKYRIVAKKLAVAAIAVLSVLLISGGGGTGAPLRAAVLILPLLQLR